MTTKIPAIISWSGGKDCAYALHKVLCEGVYDVKYLLSSFNGEHKRLSMHDVPEALIEQQAVQIGIPLIKVYVYGSSNEAYESAMAKALTHLQAEGIAHIIFGDIFLEDLRRYRENSMRAIGMQTVFPLWKNDTLVLLKDFIAKKFRSIICCVYDAYLPKQWAGRMIDESFLNELPPNVDPCGENGEYHSFCFDGPIFKKPLQISTGQVTYKALELNIAASDGTVVTAAASGFWFCELALSSVNYKHELKSCPRCTQAFECKPGHVASCHCSAVKLSDATYDLIRNKYDDCLCANCLRELSNPQQLFKEKYGSHPH